MSMNMFYNLFDLLLMCIDLLDIVNMQYSLLLCYNILHHMECNYLLHLHLNMIQLDI